MGETARFDLVQLWRSTDAEREARGLSWAALSRQVGVAPATIRRFATATNAEADGVLAVVGWLGLAPEQFVSGSSVERALLPPTGGGMIRVDMQLVTELPAWPKGFRAGSRTTIQQLVAAAQASQRSVASLTRWSAV